VLGAQTVFLFEASDSRHWRGDIALLVLAVLLAWAYLGWMIWGMQHMDVAMALMPGMVDWRVLDLLLVWAMWVLMMAGMMLPTAAPMLLAFGAMARRVDPPRPAAHTLAFGLGYLAVWAAFSVAATLLQWGLLEWRLVSPMMESSSPWLAGGLLILAGAYQFTRWKATCLALCRSPLAFLVREWRAGGRGALVMGARHGVFCLGCCWALMVLLFVLGVMNLLWIVTLTLLALAEKVLPQARWLVRASGVGFAGWGLCLLGQAAWRLA
jgi:predicted metal-binding membrane protein